MRRPTSASLVNSDSAPDMVGLLGLAALRRCSAVESPAAAIRPLAMDPRHGCVDWYCYKQEVADDGDAIFPQQTPRTLDSC
jgi:hypothetical protein